MQLTLEQIRAVTVGALTVTKEQDGIHFSKCTQKQVDAWYNLKQDLGIRAETTTGVRLDFHTDSRALSFGGTGNKYELYVNGVLQKQLLLNDMDHHAEVTLTEAGQTVHVTLYLPAHEITVLHGVELEDGATLLPHTFDRRILFVGDSITQGWESGLDGLSYAARTSRFFNAESVVQGIGGAYFHESTFDSLPFDPDWIVVAYGTNDFGHYKTAEELRSHAAAHLRLLAKEYAGKRLIYISPIWREVQEKPMGTFEACRGILIDEATKAGFCHVDGMTLVPHDPTYFTDGLHPNALGFSFYAETLCRELLK